MNAYHLENKSQAYPIFLNIISVPFIWRTDKLTKEQKKKRKRIISSFGDVQCA